MKRVLFFLGEIVAVLLHLPVLILLVVSFVAFVFMALCDEGLNALRSYINRLREARA